MHKLQDCWQRTCVDIADAHLQAVHIHEQGCPAGLLGLALGLLGTARGWQQQRCVCAGWASIRCQGQPALDPYTPTPANMSLQALDLYHTENPQTHTFTMRQTSLTVLPQCTHKCSSAQASIDIALC